VGRRRHFLFSKCTAGIPASTVGNMFSVMPVIMARMCMAGNNFLKCPRYGFYAGESPGCRALHLPTKGGVFPTPSSSFCYKALGVHSISQ